VSPRGPRWAVVPAARYAPSGPAAPGAPHWARLGDSVVVWSSAGDAAARVERLGAPPARAAGLALVIQVGRAFQDEHPDVEILVDRGRHLVVDTAALPVAPDTVTACWRVGRLPADTVIVDRPVTAAARSDPATLALLAELSPQACDSDLRWLVDRGTRHSLGQGFAGAAAWIEARLASLGYTTSRSAVTVGGGQSQNVVADRPGTAAGPRELVLVTAHLDSINLSGGPGAPAPGADDNGSGSAGLLELARVLASRRWRHDLRCILFGGEEQGLHGSRQYVAALPPAERSRIRAVLNMDMVATRNTAQLAVLLEGAAVSSGQIDALATAAATYTGLRVETSLDPFASDHVPFIDAGIPAVLTIEGADRANGHIHSDRDVMAHIDLALMQEILRMNLAALAGWLEQAVTVPRPAGPVVASAPGRLDILVVGTDAAVHHKAWDGGAWHPSATGYEPLGRPP
jgi:Peptidase family M28